MGNQWQGPSEQFTYKGKRGSIRLRGTHWSARYSAFGQKRETALRTDDRGTAIERLKTILKDVSDDETARCLDGPAPVHELSSTITASNIGAVSEMLVTIDLMNHHIPVFRAVGPNCPCDLVALVGNQCLRIEVKVGKINSKGNPKVGCMRPTCEFDVLAIVNRTQGIVYLPPIQFFQGIESDELGRRNGATSGYDDAETA